MSSPVLVVGGTYREMCMEPAINALRGSGLRAAALLASLGRTVSFTTCIDANTSDEANAMFDCFRVEATTHPRPSAMSFWYQTPVSTAQWHYAAERQLVQETGADVVGFGMVDADWKITAGRLVLDPQHGPLDALLRAATVTTGDIAVVLNQHEAFRLTGLPAKEAGPELMTRGPRIVVIKQGVLGGIVFHNRRADTYGAIPTETTQTLGSGDAFTAGFAHAWFDNPTDPLEAARFGAKVAAAHSIAGTPQVTADLLAALPPSLPYAGDLTARVYLAAPFFTTSERLFLETVVTALSDAGITVFSPLHEVGAGGDDVATKDLDGLASCHAVLALLDGGDPGTIFETGWATRYGIPVVGFTAHPDSHDWTMLRGTGGILTSDLTSAIHSAAWAAIRIATSAGAP